VTISTPVFLDTLPVSHDGFQGAFLSQQPHFDHPGFSEIESQSAGNSVLSEMKYASSVASPACFAAQ
jgi:hypothetical protein